MFGASGSIVVDGLEEGGVSDMMDSQIVTQDLWKVEYGRLEWSGPMVQERCVNKDSMSLN